MDEEGVESTEFMTGVGFMMPRLTSIPFSHLPEQFQFDLIDALNVKEKVEIFKVTSTLRAYLVKNGFFGESVDEIRFLLDEKEPEHVQNMNMDLALRILLLKGSHTQEIDILHQKVLLRPIRSCNCLWAQAKYLSPDKDFDSYIPPTSRLPKNFDLMQVAKWFPNLRFVRQHSAWWSPRLNIMLEGFEYEITGREKIDEKIGFTMRNLKSIPFLRLPEHMQAEVIQELDWAERPTLLKVSSGLRKYYAKNGIFGTHLAKILVGLGDVEGGRNFWIGHEPFHHHVGFKLSRHRVLFRNISSVSTFRLNLENPRQIEAFFAEDPIASDPSRWFSNLSFVEKLKFYSSPETEKLLESFRFKVTKHARFIECEGSTLRKNWEHFFENQLSICPRVIVQMKDQTITLPQEIPGLELEVDSSITKQNVDALKEPGRDFTRYLGSNLETHCYRKRLDAEREIIVLVCRKKASLL